MKKNIYFLSFCTLSLIGNPVSANTVSGQFNSQVQTQQQIQSDLSDITQQKLQVQDEIEAATKKMDELNQQISDSDANIQKKVIELNKINKKLDSLNKEDKRITYTLNKRKREFKDRVHAFYRTEGQMSFLNVLFSINSFGEFIDHFVAYEKIINGDKKFIEKYISDQNKVANNKLAIATLQRTTQHEKTELEGIKADQENNKKEVETLTAFLEEKKKQLEQQEQEKQLALELLQKNGAEILALINNANGSSTDDIASINSIIAPFVPDAQRLEQEKGIPASITLGQIILESSGDYNGLSGLAFEAKNLFGMKGTGTAGSISWNTTEFANGQQVVTTAAFAKYNTYYDSMVAHANLLLTTRYQKYLKNVTNIVDYANGIQAAGYATDPNYANKLVKIIYQYQLYKLDAQSPAN
jgi:flagellum-specific peptidoglycan hydrolase FlgJ